MIILILIVGLVLRLISLNQSLWLDEAININAASGLDFTTLLFKYSLGDFHPPLYHLILKSWILAFGNSEITARLPSVILGVATVFVIYLIGKKLYDQKTGLIAALLLATAPLHIYYSQEARMYMLAAFATSLSVYFFISIIKKDQILYWLGFILSTTIALYSDYLPYLMLPTYITYLILFRNKIRRSILIGFVPALILVVILLIPWLLLLPDQLKTGLSASAASPAWTQVVGAADFKNFFLTFVKFTIGRISNDNNLLYALSFLPVGIYVTLLFALSLFRLSPQRTILFFWFFIPIVAGFLISFSIPIFSYFRFIFVLPAFYLIWASAINTINWRLPTRILLISALLINLLSTAIYFVNPKFQRENWREATTYVSQKSTPETIILFESAYTFAPFDYYNRSTVEAAGGLNSFNAKEDEVKQNIGKLTQDVSHVFLFQYLSGITDPQGLLYQELTRNNFKNTQTKNFEGVGFIYEFVK